MSARDDYPWLAEAWLSEDSMTQRDGALDEIDRLRQWKAEATSVLDEWERVWDMTGRPGRLGSSKATSVLRLVSGRVWYRQ